MHFSGEQPQKLPIPLGGSAPCTYYMIPGATRVHSPKHYLDRFNRFCRAHDSVQQTEHRESDHATSVARGRIFALRVCDAA